MSSDQEQFLVQTRTKSRDVSPPSSPSSSSCSAPSCPPISISLSDHHPSICAFWRAHLSLHAHQSVWSSPSSTCHLPAWSGRLWSGRGDAGLKGSSSNRAQRRSRWRRRRAASCAFSTSWIFSCRGKKVGFCEEPRGLREMNRSRVYF